MPSFLKAHTGLGALGLSTPPSSRWCIVSEPSWQHNPLDVAANPPRLDVYTLTERVLAWPQRENSRYCGAWLILDTNPPSARNASLSAFSPDFQL